MEGERRGHLSWVTVGFGIGFGFMAAVALVFAIPATRRFVTELAAHRFERVARAARDGIRAYREREAELQGRLMAEERGIGGQGPDYIV